MEPQAQPPVSFAQLSPEALVQVCIKGEAAAWEEFMRRYEFLFVDLFSQPFITNPLLPRSHREDGRFRAYRVHSFLNDLTGFASAALIDS